MRPGREPSVTESLPRYAWDSGKRRRKGALPWTWPPVARAAPQGQAPWAQRLEGAARPPPSPRARRHFGGQAAPGGGPPPARLPDDAESVHARHSGLFKLASAVLFIAVAALIYSKSPRYR